MLSGNGRENECAQFQFDGLYVLCRKTLGMVHIIKGGFLYIIHLVAAVQTIRNFLHKYLSFSSSLTILLCLVLYVCSEFLHFLWIIPSLSVFFVCVNFPCYVQNMVVGPSRQYKFLCVFFPIHR